MNYMKKLHASFSEYYMCARIVLSFTFPSAEKTSRANRPKVTLVTNMAVKDL